MRIKTYPFDQSWNLLDLIKKESGGLIEGEEIEISNNAHAHIAQLFGTYIEVEGSDRFVEFTSWCHARKHGDTLEVYRISPVHYYAKLEENVYSLETRLLFVARRPFVVVQKDRNQYEVGSKPVKTRTNARPITAIRDVIERQPTDNLP